MAEDKILTIVKGEEFKINIKKEIDEKDIFFNQYIKAAKILDDIVAFEDITESVEWLKTESENNIIAFCGERGEGKSSAMINFVNELYSLNYKAESKLFFDCENVKKTLFSEPMVMDPSMFDEVHNVLDIVLATLYKKFREKYDLDNQCISVNDREKLLDKFQKVYRFISLINNQSQMLDDEYDFEGNISKLSKLGESTGLRNELKQLIELYLDVMLDFSNSNKKYRCLLIAIDDLDLCSANAYKMAEQIRKYLIIPNVVIVMAIKVEQLRLCVQEENFRRYRNIINAGVKHLRLYVQEKEIESYKNIVGNGIQELEVCNEISSMADRYVAKLIPRAKRIYLPKIQTIPHAGILYKNRAGRIIFEGEIKDSMNESVLEYIFLKTGMRFLINKSEENYLLPDNLRDMINIITLLGEMQDPKGDNNIYCDNILRFCSYYEKEWLFENFDTENCRGIQKLIHSNYIRLHKNSEFALRKLFDSTEKKLNTSIAHYTSETNYSFFIVINWLEIYYMNVFGNAEEKYAYAFHILYTIRLNLLLRREDYNEMAKFVGGYLWAGSFLNILPSIQGSAIDRSRFTLPTIHAYNTIAQTFSPDIDISLSDSGKTQNYVSKISEKDEKREEKIWIWLWLGLLSNTYLTGPQGQTIYTFHNASVIYSNYSLLLNVNISLENYIVGLCNLTSLYEKINMEALGVEREEFDKYVHNVEINNKDTIEAFREILTNIDLAMKFKEYCYEHRKNKEGYKDEVERTEAIVDSFFGNVEKFMKKYGCIDEQIKLHPQILQYGRQESKKEVNISHLYGLLVQASMQNIQNEQMNTNYARKGEAVKEFLSKLKEKSDYEIPQKVVSTYLRNKSAKNVKNNMDNLASNIQRYYSHHVGEELQKVERDELHNFYSKVLDYYIENPEMNISDKLHEEYKRIVSKYDR